MTVHKLYPAYVQIDYHSGYAPHSQIIPTREWNQLAGTHGNGGYLNWDGLEVDADDMVKALVNQMKALMPTGVTYDTYTIYTMDTPDSQAIPKAGGTLAIVGTEATPGWTRAVQKTFNMFDTAYNPVKLVLLDADSNDLFVKTPGGSLSLAEQAVVTEFGKTSWAWSSRAGFRPYIIRNVMVTINTKLRDSYVV